MHLCQALLSPYSLPYSFRRAGYSGYETFQIPIAYVEYLVQGIIVTPGHHVHAYRFAVIKSSLNTGADQR